MRLKMTIASMALDVKIQSLVFFLKTKKLGENIVLKIQTQLTLFQHSV